MAKTNAEIQAAHRQRQANELARLYQENARLSAENTRLHAEITALRELATQDKLRKDYVILSKETGGPNAKRRQPPRERGTRLSPDWQASTTQRDLAKSRGLDPDVTEKFFKNFWISKTGANATKLDWDRTWDNWCLREATTSGGNQQRRSFSNNEPRSVILDAFRRLYEDPDSH